MDINLPPHLESIREMLAGSLRIRSSEKAPAVPDGLLDDLNRRFAPQSLVIEPPRSSVLLRKLRGLIQSPAFGMAAAMVLVLAIAKPALTSKTNAGEGTSGFRGGASEVADPVRIILIQEPTELSNFLRSSNTFEADAFISVASYDDALGIPGKKVILDFENAILRSHQADGVVLHTSEIPATLAELPLIIATAVAEL